jgi:hypothetical protein
MLREVGILDASGKLAKKSWGSRVSGTEAGG